MASPSEPSENEVIEFVTFVAGEQSFCIEITQIREIRRWSPVTLLPHAPDHVLGVMNLRGAVIPIFDLAAKLGLGRITPTERHVIIIAAVSGQTIGLLVDSVSEILSVRSDSVQEAPNVRGDDTTSCVLGVVPVEDGMTRVIDLRRIVPNATEGAA
ncbi:chemotaxis protein CheW [Histidinibacterium aquaticum]|uniref:Purine-binding chemotaxis protein CheW n=1 Tax=Histidinibacterium aquaticum TaxID=2613962 RepID=A0A5J5GID7_9RHOB|nr:chemotaxis protein CheW [Histidinibacterium aquaticum]KAA9007971.1 purine-binding chemotaxis protein CheW [Histidinibacterium aquaticum]